MRDYIKDPDLLSNNGKELRLDNQFELGEKQNSINCFRLFSLKDANSYQPPIKYLVENIIPEGSLVCVYGDPGTCKTYIGLSLGCCIASGLPFLGKKVTEGGVLFIDEESGRNRIMTRMRKVGRGLGISECPFYAASYSGLNILDGSDHELLIQTIRIKGISFVIIDTFAALNNGKDENLAEFIQPVIKAFKLIIERTGASILFIHHANKSGGYRGSTAIKGGVDIMIKVTTKNNMISFFVEKSRDYESHNFSAKFIFGDNSFKLVPTNYSPKMKNKRTARDAIIHYLKENGPATTEELLEGISGFVVGTLKNNISKLIEDGVIKRLDKGGQGTKAIYTLINRQMDLLEDEDE